jgi:hypothetical protein
MPHVVGDGVGRVVVGERVIVEDGHAELVDDPRLALGCAWREQAGRTRRFDLALDEVGEGSVGFGERFGVELLESPVLRRHEPPAAVAVERRGARGERVAVRNDHLADDRDEQLVFAAEVPVEGL